MPLRDLLKKKDKSSVEEHDGPQNKPSNAHAPPEFTFVRTTTTTEEIITPPGDDGSRLGQRFSKLGFRPSSNRKVSSSSNISQISENDDERSGSKEKLERPGGEKRRLSHRLGLKREKSSSNLPDHLPDIDNRSNDTEHVEGQWEQRATLLARSNETSRSRQGSPERGIGHAMGLGIKSTGVIGKGEGIVDQKADDNIQEAIRLHEEGSLEEATKMFGRLADPGGTNNALSQVLYGLALRHGWGCEADPQRAMQYMSAAAANAASIEEQALAAGSKKGGAAKGELVLAIFELANSFRHGWGVKKDPIAAKQYYETAANLGDTDAMNEVGWCYLEGFGCKKDKMQAAKYYRLAEKGGSKILGNTWIWKPKYDPVDSK